MTAEVQDGAGYETAPPPAIQHGTYAGWNAHIKADTKPCWDCREAARQYMAEWRKKHPNAYALNNKARNRALSRLQRLHPDEYAEIYAQEFTNLRRLEALR